MWVALVELSTSTIFQRLLNHRFFDMSSPMRIYYDPFTGFDRLFEDAFVAPCSPERGQNTERVFRPRHVLVYNMPSRHYNSDTFFCRMDIHENKDMNTVTATFELPGLKSEDISIEIHQNRLTVSGEFHKEESRVEEGYTIRERRQGKFSRAIQLPTGVKVRDDGLSRVACADRSPSPMM